MVLYCICNILNLYFIMFKCFSILITVLSANCGGNNLGVALHLMEIADTLANLMLQCLGLHGLGYTCPDTGVQESRRL